MTWTRPAQSWDNYRPDSHGTLTAPLTARSVMISKTLQRTNYKHTARKPMTVTDIEAPWNAYDYSFFLQIGGIEVADGIPHTHEITVSDNGYWWGITYGDTNITPNKPYRAFWPWQRRESESLALRRHIRACIRKHDKGSRTYSARKAAREAQRNANRLMIVTAIKDLTPKRSDEWGDKQI